MELRDVHAVADPDVLDNLSLCFPSQAAHVRDAVERLRRFLEGHGAPAHLCTSTEIVAAELLNNVFEHAYCERPDGTISLDAVLLPDMLCLTVCDRGLQMPDHRLPPPHLPCADGPLETLPEGGFGWYLLHALTETLAYRRLNGVNVTECTLRLAPPLGAPGASGPS